MSAVVHLSESLSRLQGVRPAARLAGARRTVASGFEPLDALLPGGGWPIGAVTELQVPATGIGEIRLVAPALASTQGLIAFIGPPADPCVHALGRMAIAAHRILVVEPDVGRDRQWAAEQLLGVAAAVLIWQSAAAEDRGVRRLQLAAERGGSLCFLLSPPGRHAIPASLRLALAPASSGAVLVDVFKRPGPRAAPITLTLDHALARAPLPRPGA